MLPETYDSGFHTEKTSLRIIDAHLQKSEDIELILLEEKANKILYTTLFITLIMMILLFVI